MKPLKEFYIDELLRRQSMLDDKFKKKMGITHVEPMFIALAYLDEVGELIHELKPLWCYWKKEHKEINMQRVLEELSDCLHFALSYENTKEPKLLDVFEIEKHDYLWHMNNLKNIDTAIDSIIALLEYLKVPMETFLEVHHKVWLRNMNIRTGDDY